MDVNYYLHCLQMEALSRGELLPKIVEVYSRPTRIVRGKDINDDLEVLSFTSKQKYFCSCIKYPFYFPFLRCFLSLRNEIIFAIA